MTEILIDFSTANRLINEVVTPDKEDFVYESGDGESTKMCLYVRDGEPSCLIGQALFKVGMTIEELAKLDNYDNAGIGIVNLPRRFHLDGDAREIFTMAQITQDRGHTWGEAKKKANAIYESFSMTEITIDLDRAKELLEEVVKGNEDFIYAPPADENACVYQHEGKPSCVVGQALFKAGVTPEELERMDDQGIIKIATLPDRVTLTDEARDYFDIAQSIQDTSRDTWGYALQAANDYYSEKSQA